jgi:hypothetical protein
VLRGLRKRLLLCRTLRHIDELRQEHRHKVVRRAVQRLSLQQLLAVLGNQLRQLESKLLLQLRQLLHKRRELAQRLERLARQLLQRLGAVQPADGKVCNSCGVGNGTHRWCTFIDN